MKKLIIILALLSVAAAPARVTNYTSNTTIRAADVSGNENAIFNYLSAGVDTFADGSIINADISSSAALAYSKLNLAGSIVNADIASSAAIVASKLDLTAPGGVGTTTPAAGKFTTLEATSTLKLGTTNQGDILYDNGTSLIRLTPGTSGQFLKTQGASANPTWTDGPGIPNNIQVFTTPGTATWTKPAGISKVYVKVWGAGGGGGSSSTSDGGGGGGGGGGYSEGLVTVTGNVTVTVGTGGTAGSAGNGGNGELSSFAGATTPTGAGGSGGAIGPTGAGGAAGAGSNGTINVTGQAGRTIIAGQTSPAIGGDGGVSFSQGGGGKGGYISGSTQAGSDGGQPGAGGGGGASNAAGDGAGGAGANGMVIVYY